MDGKGTLVVRVTTSRAQIPVEGASVVVTQKTPEGKYILLSVQATDNSGEIKPISIPTPALSDSEQPGATQLPYTVCDVWAEHPDYAMLLVEGVQIFDGVVTLQTMQLSPLYSGQSSLIQNEVRDIPSQNL